MVVYLIRFSDDTTESTEFDIPIFSSREKAERYLRDEGFKPMIDEDEEEDFPIDIGWEDSSGSGFWAGIEEVEVR